jgi:septal ring factor EnvC (AmiA/AmiB activator)
MSVILKDIILGVENDTYSFQEILIEVTKREQELKAEIIKLQTEKEKNKQRIKDLDKQVQLLEELLYGSRSYI